MSADGRRVTVIAMFDTLAKAAVGAGDGGGRGVRLALLPGVADVFDALPDSAMEECAPLLHDAGLRMLTDAQLQRCLVVLLSWVAARPAEVWARGVSGVVHACVLAGRLAVVAAAAAPVALSLVQRIVSGGGSTGALDVVMSVVVNHCGVDGLAAVPALPSSLVSDAVAGSLRSSSPRQDVGALVRVVRTCCVEIRARLDVRCAS